MKSSSLKAIEAGITAPREYRDALIHDWNLKLEFREHLSIFLLTETTPEKLFFNMKDGELKVRGKTYSITWINSPAHVREAKVLLVSLRYCKHLERGYALVKELDSNNEYPVLEYT